MAHRQAQMVTRKLPMAIIVAQFETQYQKARR